MPKEARARLKINKLLEDAGWRLLDGAKGKANVIVEGNVKMAPISENKDWGDDYEKVYTGFIDYLLLDEKNYPLCVLEAKSESKDPLIGKEKARQYAKGKNSRFVILSNGNLHYLWDIERGNPAVISAFPSQESIKHIESFKPNPEKLTEEKVEHDYVVLTQAPDYKDDPRWESEENKIEKKNFKLFDFFANCEYFEEHYNYDEVIKLPPETGTIGPGGDGPVRDEAEVFIPDPLKTFVEAPVGSDGMKVDRKFFEKFEKKVKEDPVVKENFEKGNIEAAEQYITEKIFDKPKEFFNITKLRKSVQADRRISLREFLEKIFGIIPRFKSKDELLNEEYEKFLLINKPDNKYVIVAKNYFKAYITDQHFRTIVEHKDYGQFYSYPGFTMEEFQKLNSWSDQVPEYVKDYVSINKFLN